MVRVFWVCLVSSCLVACASLPTSSKGLYGLTPEGQVSQSADQVRRVIVSDFDVADTKHAVQKALGLEGVSAEVVKSNMLSGIADWVPSPYDRCYCGFAAYFRPSGQGRTEVVLLVDQFEGMLRTRGAAKRFSTKLVSSINAVLASYE